MEGAENPDTEHSAGNSKFRRWAASQQLTEETIDVLLANAVDSRQALAALTPSDLPSLGLKLGQLALVRRLVGAATGTSATASAISLTQSLRVSTVINICQLT